MATQMNTSDATFPFRLGSFSCLVVNDATARYPLGMFLTNPPPPHDRTRLGLSDDAGAEVEMSYNCLVIDTGRERVLVDTGFGAGQGSLRHHLRARGIDEGSIDIVVLSHAHPDHIGGVVGDDGALAFPRARHVMLQQEWDYWISDPSLDELPVDVSIKEWIRGAARAGLAAMKDKVDLLQPDTAVVSGITAKAAFGHSPGHMVIEVASAGEQLLFAADAILMPVNLPYPEARGATDHLPDVMVETRIRLLERAARDACLVCVSHFAFPGLGYVRPAAERWTWEPRGTQAAP
jgi:glyoxylase-like metal-dependent hydrolase (beta-lactamase superfamily II)